jgi:hypothetical protein
MAAPATPARSIAPATPARNIIDDLIAVPGFVCPIYSSPGYCAISTY